MAEQYEAVRAAAERLRKGESGNRWTLASAVLVAVPEIHRGNFSKKSDTPRAGGITSATKSRTPEALAELAERLTADGVRTPNEDNYSASSLAHLRDTAMAWPEDQRHPEAAYRTHQEAGATEDRQANKDAPNGRAILSALCAVARGENPKRPARTDQVAWQRAVELVQGRRERRHPPTYLVTRNDLRVAMEKRRTRPLVLTEKEEQAAEVVKLLRDPEILEATAAQMSVDEAREIGIDLAVASAAQTEDDDGAEVNLEGREISRREREALEIQRERLDWEGRIGIIEHHLDWMARTAAAGDQGLFGDRLEGLQGLRVRLDGVIAIVSGAAQVTDEGLRALLEGGK